MSLFIVGTPIGNLQDITLRALETLKTADKIYCEDTRRTRQLLAYFHIQKTVDSLHQHSSEQKIARVVNELKAGQEIAYVSDAGTPGVADPGGKLVEAARQAEIPVIPIPGVSAVTTVLSVAGVPADSFWFAGYLPTKKGRETLIRKIIAYPDTVVVFETAPRLLRFLTQLTALGGADKKLTVGRELTKQFEEIRVGLPSGIQEHFTAHPAKGELVLVIS